jgi:selenide,water dikinase
MGGRPLTVLCILGFPGALDPSVMGDILRGSADVVRESGAVVAGGHTIVDPELKFGLSVTGVVHPDRIVRNSTAQVGDVLILTKPIGTGLVTTGVKRGVVTDPQVIERVTRNMATLNRAAAEAMVEVGVSAGTDITGYGLIGHALEMADGSGVTLRLSYSAIPRYPEDVETLVATCMSGGTSNNRRYALPKISFHPDLSREKQAVMFDAQTSGGLLMSVPAAKAPAMLAALEAHGVETRAVIGEVLPRGAHPIEVVT